MCPRIAITMTATLRPTILRKTLNSFCSNCFNMDEVLIINIDPVGIHDTEHMCVTDTIECIISEYWSRRNSILYTPLHASFPAAFKRVWQKAAQTDFDYIFHLEDDWQLLRGVDLSDMIHLMEENEDLMILRLSQFPTGQNRTKNWNKWLYWTGEFFESKPEEKGLLGFCGHPSLIKREFVEAALKVLDGIHNPEKQIKGHNKIMKPLYDKGRFGVYSPQNCGPTVMDIGRPWMVKNGFKKQGDKANFTQWEKV